jgi:hypothetical protein
MGREACHCIIVNIISGIAQSNIHCPMTNDRKDNTNETASHGMVRMRFPYVGVWCGHCNFLCMSRLSATRLSEMTAALSILGITYNHD